MSKAKPLDSKILDADNAWTHHNLSAIMKIQPGFDEADLPNLKQALESELRVKAGNFYDTKYLAANTGHSVFGIGGRSGATSSAGMAGSVYSEIRDPNGRLKFLIMHQGTFGRGGIDSPTNRMAIEDPGSYNFWGNTDPTFSKSYWNVLVEEYFEKDALISASVQSYTFCVGVDPERSVSRDTFEGAAASVSLEQMKGTLLSGSEAPALSKDGSGKIELDLEGLADGAFVGWENEEIDSERAYKWANISQIPTSGARDVYHPTYVAMSFENLPAGAKVTAGKRSVSAEYTNFSNTASAIGGRDIDTVERTSNVATITCANTRYSHSLQVGDSVMVNAADSGYNNGGSPVTVTAVPSNISFQYANTGADEAATADAGFVGEQYSAAGQLDCILRTQTGYTFNFGGIAGIGAAVTLPNPAGSIHESANGGPFTFTEKLGPFQLIFRQGLNSDRSEMLYSRARDLMVNFLGFFNPYLLPASDRQFFKVENASGSALAAGAKVVFHNYDAASGENISFQQKKGAWVPTGRCLNDYI
jgi:hypothetical protein